MSVEQRYQFRFGYWLDTVTGERQPTRMTVRCLD